MDFATGVYLSDTPSPPLHTVYVSKYTVNVFIHTGMGGGGRENQREGYT
jgi:hypothetical protein